MSQESAPFVSVLMSTRNRLHYLKGAIESILVQSFKDFELIIVNDGSADKTGEFLSSINDERIVVISHETSKGLSESLSEAVERAKGRYCARMDDDDLCDPDRFRQQVEFLETNLMFDVVATGAELIDEKSRLLGKKFPAFEDPDLLGLYFVFESPICHPSVMIRTDALRSAGSYRMKVLVDRDHFGAEDYELWTRRCFAGRIGILPNSLVFYRMHSSKLTDGSAEIALNQRLVSEAYIDSILPGCEFKERLAHSYPTSSLDSIRDWALGLSIIAGNLAKFDVPKTKELIAIKYLAQRSRVVTKGWRYSVPCLISLALSSKCSSLTKCLLIVSILFSFRSDFSERFRAR